MVEVFALNASLAANATLVSAAYASVALGIIHWTNRDYDVISQPMSYYAVGASGFLMTTLMLAFAASVIMLSFGLENVTGLSSGGIAVFRVAGASMLIAAIFPSDVTDSGLPEMPIGLIHTIASYLFSPCLVAAALLLSRRFDALGLPDRPRFVIALASWLMLIVLIVINLFQWAIGGIVQRIFVGLTWLWLLMTTLQLKTLRRS